MFVVVRPLEKTADEYSSLFCALMNCMPSFLLFCRARNICFLQCLLPGVPHGGTRSSLPHNKKRKQPVAASVWENLMTTAGRQFFLSHRKLRIPLLSSAEKAFLSSAEKAAEQAAVFPGLKMCRGFFAGQAAAAGFCIGNAANGGIVALNFGGQFHGSPLGGNMVGF